MGTLYPNDIDGYAQLPLVVDQETEINAITVNRIRDAVVAVERELGANPKDSYTNVASRLTEMSQRNEVVICDIASSESFIRDSELKLDFGSVLIPLVGYSIQSCNIKSGSLTPIYKNNHSFFDSNNEIEPGTSYNSSWVISNNHATLTSNDMPGSKYRSRTPKRADGKWYIEFLCEEVQDSTTRIGLIYQNQGEDQAFTTDDTVGDSSLGSFIGYQANGDVYLHGTRVATGLTALTNGCTLGMFLEFTGYESIFSGTQQIDVYFSVNGVWQNSANPETSLNPFSTSGLSFTADLYFTVSSLFGTSAIALLEFIDSPSIIPGDYILIDDKIISFDLAYVWDMKINQGSGGTGITISITIGDGGGATTYVITGAGAENASLDLFDGEAGNSFFIASSIVNVINSPSSTIGAAGAITASIFGGVGNPCRIIFETIAPYNTSRYISDIITSSGAITTGDGGPIQVIPLISSVQNYESSTAYAVSNLIGYFPNNTYTPNASNTYADTVYSDWADRNPFLNDTVMLISALPNTSGNGVSITTSNLAAFSVPTTFSNGCPPSIITVKSIPSTFSYEPEFEYTAWLNPSSTDQGVPAILSQPLPPMFGPQTYENFDFIADDITAIGTVGRSRIIRTTEDYDGGDVELKFYRSDTNSLEDLTINITPGVDYNLDIPFGSVLRFKNTGNHTAGRIDLLLGSLWSPLGVTMSVDSGEVVASELSSDPTLRPYVLVFDENYGMKTQYPSIGGTYNNMIDLDSIDFRPIQTATRRFVYFYGVFIVIK